MKKRLTFWLPTHRGRYSTLSGFCGLVVNVYRVTYFYDPRGGSIWPEWALLLALVPMVIFIRKGRLKGKRVAGAIKLYLGFFICSLPVAMFVILQRLGHWEETIPHGANLTGMNHCPPQLLGGSLRPELKRDRICNPKGNVYSNSTLYVEKRSNALGIGALGDRAPESVKLRARKSPLARLQHPKATYANGPALSPGIRPRRQRAAGYRSERAADSWRRQSTHPQANL